MHLRYCGYASMDAGENRHPQVVMRELGITYQHATPQSIMDAWWFWNCKNVPVNLPPFLRELKIDPLEQVGNGLSAEKAAEIAHGAETMAKD
jgi:hypothetical protein